MAKRKILIFSVSFGNGHNQVSKSLKNEFLRNKLYDVEIIDTFDVISKTFHKIILDSYLQLLRLKPSIWGRLYHYSEQNPNSIFLKQFNAFLTTKLNSTLNKYNPVAIITTHPIATTLLANVIRKKRLSIDLYALLTDFAIHPMSVHSEVKGYFIASEHLTYFSKLYNLDKTLLYPTGIPATKNSLHEFPKRVLRNKLQLHEEKKTILIAGGGVGLAKFSEILAGLEAYHEPLQIICVTGENKRARQRIQHIKSKHYIRTLGFTHLFMEYLRASDVVISKAGGVTMTEALLCETPVLIFQPLPGQEEQNSQFLMNYGSAIKAEIVEEIPVLLERIIFNNHYHKIMTKNAQRLKEPYSAKRIVEIINKNISEERVSYLNID